MGITKVEGKKINLTFCENDFENEIAYAVVVLVYGDTNYLFNSIEMVSLKAILAEATLKHLIPGQTAEIFTMGEK